MEIEERLVFFPSGSLSLAGILSVPRQPNGVAVLIAWGGGAFPSSGRNRIRTRMARDLAERGFYAFRFDYQGVGESEGHFRDADLNEHYGDDIVAAAAWLASEGQSSTVVVANCLGAWSALLSAPSISGLAGLAMIGPPVRRDHMQVAAHHQPIQWWVKNLKRLSLSKLMSRKGWARYRKLITAKFSSMTHVRRDDSRFSDAIGWLVDHDIPFLVLNGPGSFCTDFENELDNGLRDIIEKAGPSTRVSIVTESLSGYASLMSQEIVLRETSQWLSELPIHVE